jgi:hypothetical protein
MPNQYVSPADKLARQLLKAAVKTGRPLTPELIKGLFARETTDALSAGVAHAMLEGWLTARRWLGNYGGRRGGREALAGGSQE